MIDQLRDELTPHLRAAIEARKAEIMATLPLPKRLALGALWVVLMLILPKVVESALALFAVRFGSLTVLDLVSILMAIKQEARARGLDTGIAMGDAPCDAP